MFESGYYPPKFKFMILTKSVSSITDIISIDPFWKRPGQWYEFHSDKNIVEFKTNIFCQN